MRQYHRDHPEKGRANARAWRESNRERHRQYTRDWRVDHPGYHSPYNSEQARARHLAARGLTQDEYDRLLARQHGVCFFCGKPETADRKTSVIKRLSVDHDHETGRIRGLLCIGCNISLGYFQRGMKSRLDPDRVKLYLSVVLG
jgi:hypothetical protein